MSNANIDELNGQAVLDLIMGRLGRSRGGIWKTHPAAIGDRVFEFIVSIYQ
jgi:hypothetical protein